MYKIYYNRVVTGQITFQEVPSELKPLVLEYARHQVDEGKLSEEDYLKFFGAE